MSMTLYYHKTVQNESLKLNESTFIFKEKVKKKKILSFKIAKEKKKVNFSCIDIND